MPCRARGTLRREVVFVGEGPGFNEDQQGRPFVGAAGSLLNELLKAIGWRRDEVFITNVVKCRPPANRDPEPNEVEACAPYLRRQLEILDPALIATLGRHSLQTFRPGARISQVHGSVVAVDPATGAGQAVTASLYHPAAALRQGSLRETDARRHDAPAAGAGSTAAPPAGRTVRPNRRHRLRTPTKRSNSRSTARSKKKQPRRPMPSRLKPSSSAPPVTTPKTRWSFSDQMNDVLRVLPLGGVGEIGKNMYVFEYGNEIVVIDCGLMFPEHEMFGVDFVVPDVTYLRERRDNVKAFLITHAHEDHVGGLPFVLPYFPGVPIYASTLARGLLGNKIKEHKLNNNPLKALEPGETVELGAFTATAFRIGHSIPDAMGIALDTPNGLVVHTGDFKFDHTPVDGKMSDIHALAEFGQRGVLCLLSDSTRAERPGYTPSERIVGEAFRDIMEGLDGRVIVATFASNIARIQQVFDAAATFNRKVAVIGRSMEQNVRIARDLGYLRFPDAQIVSKDRIREIPAKDLVIATTGAQGEPMAGLARMANRDHRFVEIQPDDTVIVSASPIPGNEESVGRTIDNLFKAGANVYYHDIKRAHVSGHASQEELKLMLNLVRPRHFIPMHGEFRMLVQHGRLAQDMGVAADNIYIIENGQPIEFMPDGTGRRGTPVEAGYVYVDGLSVGEVGDVVLRDRRALATDGMFLVVVTVDKQTGNIVGRPEIVTRGFVGGPDDPVIAGAADRAAKAIANPGNHTSDVGLLKAQIKDSLSQYLYDQTKRRPMVFPVVVEI